MYRFFETRHSDKYKVFFFWFNVLLVRWCILFSHRTLLITFFLSMIKYTLCIIRMLWMFIYTPLDIHYTQGVQPVCGTHLRPQHIPRTRRPLPIRRSQSAPIRNHSPLLHFRRPVAVAGALTLNPKP